jgi:glycosyltransferase involved in cell wall biosynthesis
MSKRKVLYVIHGHPAIRPGGAEGYTLELYEAMRSSEDYEPILLARNGPPHATGVAHPQARISLVGDDPRQFLFETDANDFDWFLGTSPNKAPLTRDYTDFLLEHRPDVVHFGHTLFMGYDMIRATRRALPDAAIVYTLHEYLPICHRHGQMVRTRDDELCLHASPLRCHECFPTVAPREFHLRKAYVMSHFADVDLFIAPSRFLMERYLDWGIPEDRMIHEDYGRLPIEALGDAGPDRDRKRIGFFGQFSHYKGVNVLLEAMAIVHAQDPEARLWLHGANLDIQPPEFQEQFNDLLTEAGDSVVMVGRYQREEMPRLMANVDWVVIPSRWWENSPLVIQEAFAYGRPIICSNIGGMAEKVTDGVNGFHFRVGDPVDLAEKIVTATADSQAWERMRAAVTPLYDMDEHTAKLERAYAGLLAGNRAGAGVA